MREVDGRLSQRAQAHWPGALVARVASRWLLERPGVEAVALGTEGASYGAATQALNAMIRAERESIDPFWE